METRTIKELVGLVVQMSKLNKEINMKLDKLVMCNNRKCQNFICDSHYTNMKFDKVYLVDDLSKKCKDIIL